MSGGGVPRQEVTRVFSNGSKASVAKKRGDRAQLVLTSTALTSTWRMTSGDRAGAVGAQ